MSTNASSTTRMTTRTGLRWMLIVQSILAVVLVLSDVQIRWLPRVGDNEALPTGPVTPGDQVRQYDPSQTHPEFTDTTTLPQVDLPSNLPSRLEFTVTEVDGFGEILMINGPIKPGDAARFDGYLDGLANMPDHIALNSPGGIVMEALEIGRRVREAEVNTVMLPGMACLSACPYILAAGTERRVSNTADVGMHQHYFEAPGYMPVFLAVEDIQHGQGKTMEYLIGMGIDPGLMVYSLNTPPDEIYLLVEQELLDSRLATSVVE